VQQWPVVWLFERDSGSCKKIFLSAGGRRLRSVVVR
jgi:hypothetical protein